MYDCIIIGAGPAGLMTGIKICKNNKVLIIEKNSKPGKKLLLTGNGRCNITNLKDNNTFIENVNYNKKYLYGTINNFGPYDIYDFFTTNNVLLKEENDNKIFPKSDKAKDILDALLNNINDEIINYNETVTDIKYSKDNIVVITNKAQYKAKNIVIATGGASFKKTGSNGEHMKFAEQINQPTIKLFPAEVGVITKEKPLSLAGTSFNEVEVKYQKKKVNGNLMYTHKGLSGTAIMSLSEHIYKNEEKTIYIDYLPNITKDQLEEKILTYPKEKEVSSFLNQYFSKKFQTYIIKQLNYQENIKIKNLNKKMCFDLLDIIKNHKIELEKTDDLDNAYVTGGGINMKYINSKTMESVINNGIYFVGETLDLHGPIGGYNLTIALSTGYSAGKAINDKLQKNNKNFTK